MPESFYLCTLNEIMHATKYSFNDCLFLQNVFEFRSVESYVSFFFFLRRERAKICQGIWELELNKALSTIFTKSSRGTVYTTTKKPNN